MHLFARLRKKVGNAALPGRLLLQPPRGVLVGILIFHCPGAVAQAVGGAVGHNKISIIIPCHRVVGTGGSLTGYAGGIDKKMKLLKLECTDMTGFLLCKSIAK